MDAIQEPSVTTSEKPKQMADKGQVPDLLKIGPESLNSEMEVLSDILDPVVFNQHFCRFRLQNKGILHSNSKITFSVDVSAHDDGVSAFPLGVGCMGLIDRCVLKIGGNTVSECSDFGHFSSYQSTFINPQHNKQREYVTTGRQMCRKWEYDDGALAGGTAGSGATVSDTSAPKYTLDFGNEINRLNKVVGARQNDMPREVQFEKGGGDSKNGTKTSPVFQISLNDLFRFMKMNQLALYLFKEDIDIELYFSDSHIRGITLANHNANFHINRDDVKLVADYIFFPQELMTQYAEANRNMSFTYVDYRLSKSTIVADGVNPNKIIQNIGGSGRVVNKVMYMLSLNRGAADNPERTLFNVYTSRGGDVDRTNGNVPSRNMGVLSHNLRYNDEYLYPIDITNRSRLFSNLAQSHGSNPFISKDEYSGEQDLISAELVFGRSLSPLASTHFTYVEDRLNRNQRVNSRGIEIYRTFDSLPAGTYTLRVYLELVKMAVLKDGILTSTFA